MEERYKLRQDIVSRINNQNNVGCVQDVLNHFTVMGIIPHTYWGSDIYGMNRGTDKKSNNTYIDVPKLSKTPLFIMKVAYQSETNVKEAKLLKNITDKFGKRTPHVSLYYKHLLCDHTKFRGYRKQGIRKSSWRHERVKEGKSVITLMEYSGKSMYEFFKKNKDPMQEYYYLVQLLYTIHMMQVHKFTHGDLVFSNVTYVSLESKNRNNVWEYKINDTSYYVRLGTHIPMLIDFGEGTLNTTPEEYNKEYNSSDPWILLEQWSFHTYHTDVKKFVENIMNHMYVHNLNNKNKNNRNMVKRYLWAKNILKDFFADFTWYDEGNLTKTWK